MPNIPKTVFKLAAELVEYQAKKVFGDGFINTLSSGLTNLVGESVSDKINAFLAEGANAENLIKAFDDADKEFYKRGDQTQKEMISQMPLARLDAFEKLASALPKTLDTDGLLEALRSLFASDWGNLTADVHINSAKLYRTCLERSLAIRCNQILPSIFAKLERIDAKQDETLESQRRVETKENEILESQKRTERILESSSARRVSYAASHRNILERNTQSVFGGRERQLERMEAFFNQNASGYVVITGLSGIGKTTLMGHVIKRAALAGLDCIYYFLSQRDNTADEYEFLRGICSQLIDYYKEATFLPENISDLRALFIELLGRLSPKDKRLLFVIDGLDEADGWSPNRNMFPANLSKGVFVVLSARNIADRDWVAELELPRGSYTTIPLAVLNEDEIVNVFHSAGGTAAEWIERPGFSKEVNEISSGDPFYIHLLLEDIESSAIASPKEILNRPKGLENYLDQWWREATEDADEPSARDLLGYLAIARGPLVWTDLVNINPVDSLTGFTLGKALEQIKRFVIGDGETGYSLCHPLFQDFVLRRLAGLQAQYEDRLIQYCLAAWRNRSTYALRNLVTHLCQKAAFSELHHILMEPEFMRARRILSGSYYDFLEDVQRATEISEKAGYAGLPDLIFYSLLHSVLRTQTGNIAPEVLKILAEMDELERAINYARSIADHHQKALAFQLLGGGGFKLHNFFADFYQLRHEKLKHDSHLLALALEEAKNIGDVEERARFLNSLAPDLARSGNAELAFQCLHEIGKEFPNDDEYIALKLDAQRKIPVELAQAGKLQDALAAIEGLEDNYYRNKARKEVVRELARLGMIEAAFDLAVEASTEPEIVESLSWGLGFREDGLRRVIEAAKALNQKDRRSFTEQIASSMRVLIKEAESKDESQIRTQQHSIEIAEKARLSAWLGNYESAVELLRSLGQNRFFSYPSDWLDLFANGLLALGRKDDVLYLIQNYWVSHDFEKRLPLWEESMREFKALANANESRRIMMGLLERLAFSWDRSAAIESLAIQLIETEHLPVVEECFDRDLEDAFSAGHVLSDIVIHLARKKMFGEAETLLMHLDDYHSENILSSFAGALIGVGRQDEVVPFAKRLIKKTYDRCKALARVAAEYASEDKSEASTLLEEALIDAERPEEYRDYLNKVLLSIARNLVAANEIEKAFEIGKLFMGSEPVEYAKIACKWVRQTSKLNDAETRLTDLLRNLDQLPDNNKKHILLCCLAIALAEQDELKFAMVAVNKVDTDSWIRAYSLAILAGKNWEVDQTQAKQLLERALQIAETIKKTSSIESSKLTLGEATEGTSIQDEDEMDEEPMGEYKDDALPDLRDSTWFVSPLNFDFSNLEWIFTSVERFLHSPYNMQLQPDAEDVLLLISHALLATGRTEEALNLVADLPPEHFGVTQTMLERIVRVAATGDSSGAHELLLRLRSVEPTLENEVSQFEVVLWFYEFRRFVKMEDYESAEKVAQGIISFFQSKGAFNIRESTDNEDWDVLLKVEGLFDAISKAYAENQNVQGVINLLSLIPDNLATIRLIEQFNCICNFLITNNRKLAETLAATIDNQRWGKIATALIKSTSGNVSIREKNQSILSALREMQMLVEVSNSVLLKDWIPSIIIDIIVELCEFQDVLTVISSFGDLTSGYEVKERLILTLARKGFVDEAFHVLASNPSWYERQRTMESIVLELMNLPSEKALDGVHELLRLARTSHLDFACEIISQLVPLIGKYAGKESVWAVSNSITATLKFWS